MATIDRSSSSPKMAENNGEGYNGGPCIVCKGTQFEDSHDGFYSCTGCDTQATRDGMFAGTFDENGCYVENIYYGPYTPTVPPPGLACPNCASTKLVDGFDYCYHCTDCPTKMYKRHPSMTFTLKSLSWSASELPAPDPLPEPEPELEPEWDCAMCHGSRPDCQYCLDWLDDDTTL